MSTRLIPALCATVLASTFSLGLILSSHDYTTTLPGTTEGASLLSSLLSPDSEQLAYGGYTKPTPPPPPSQTQAHINQSRTEGRGGTPPSGHDPASGGGGNTSNPSNDGCGGCGGGSGNGTGGSNHDIQQNSRDGVASPGSGGTSPTPPSKTGGESRDHQDTPASREAEQQAQRVHDAAAYADTLSTAGSGDPTADAHTPQNIAQKVGSTLSALEQAMNNLMGGTAAPVDNGGAGHIQGLDGDQPAYQGPGIKAGEFKTMTDPGTNVNQKSGGPSPEDLRQALRFGLPTEVTPSHYVTSAATEQAIKILKQIDKDQMTQAAAFQKHLGNKISTADSIVAVSEIDKTIAGECAKGGGCSDNERIAIANTIMNRINIDAAKKDKLDIHDILDSFDANMQAENQRKGGVPDNTVYAKADVGTPQYSAGAEAVNAVLDGKLPADMPDSVRLATNYYNPDSSNPDWSKDKTLGTQYGPHKFLAVNGSTPEQVQAANDKVAAGHIKAEVSFYKGMYDPASPQAAKIATEVTRSLTVAGRNIHIVTESDGLNTQGPSHFQTDIVAGKPDNQITISPAADTVPATVAPQKTSLDDPKNSNVPAPADVKRFLVDRGMDPNAVVNGQFAYRLTRAIASAETATGKKQTNLINSGYRTPEEQAGLYATYIKHDYVFKGVTYPPNPANLGHLAAAPAGGLIMEGPHKGTIAPGSRHEFGAATDLNTGPIRDYVRANAAKFGLETLGLKPDGSIRDLPHVQLSSDTYRDPAVGKNAAPLDTKIGPSSTARPQKPQVATTPTAPDAGQSWLSSIPSLADIKQKATDLAKSAAPSEATQKKLEIVSKLPPWAQNFVLSFYTNKGGSTPSNTTPTGGGHGGSGSSFFPEAERATTTMSTRSAAKVDVTTLPWWQQYQAKLEAVRQSTSQQNI